MGKANYILDLIEEGEHQRLDFKFEISDSRKIARTLSAFANTDGGTLLIGVKDNGKVAGVRSEEEYYMIESAAEMYCQPRVPFRAKSWNVDGKTVLEVVISPSPDRPHRAPDKENQQKAYIRIADENYIAPEIIVLAWEKTAALQGRHIRLSRPVERLLRYLDENPHISLTHFRKIARINYHTAKNILSDLLAIGALGYKLEGTNFVYASKK